MPPSAIEAADAAIADAEARVAHRQEAMPVAEAETKRAEKLLVALPREECRRRAPLIKAAADAAMEHWMTGQRDFGRLDVLRSDTERAARDHSHSARDLETFLARSAEFA